MLLLNNHFIIYIRGVGQPSPRLTYMKRLTLFFLISIIFTNFTYGQTCSDTVDCLQSIDERLENITDSGSTDPSSLITYEQYEEFNNNIIDFIEVFGIFAGLTLFGIAFPIGLFLYNKR